MIEVVDFHKTFPDQIAVSGMTFDIEKGDILGLIGPNGAGKTTTLRTLAGVLPASRGRLLIAGHDVEEDSIAAKSNVAFIPDDPPLFHDLTVEDHLAFYASIYDVGDAQKRAQQLLEEFELVQKCRTPASDLSRGMRQKLAICCAYLHDPQAILLDEPLTGLDPRGIRRLKQSLRDRAAQGAAIVISSHLLAMVEDICSHVMILNNGTQQYFGPIDELRETFCNRDGPATLEEIFFEATAAAPVMSTP